MFIRIINVNIFETPENNTCFKRHMNESGSGYMFEHFFCKGREYCSMYAQRLSPRWCNS
jgi:hypothetical protein